jgi:hypothetical protein
MYVTTSDAHIAYLAQSAGFDEWYELFLDDKFMDMATAYHKAMVSYIKTNYVNVSGQ